jgi:hypothetical protein
MLHSYLAYQLAHTDGYCSCKFFLAVLGYPYLVNLNIVLRVRAYSVPFRGTILHELFLRLKANCVLSLTLISDRLVLSPFFKVLSKYSFEDRETLR